MKTASKRERATVFALTPEETSSKTSVVKFAKKLPPVKKTSCKKTNADNAMKRQAFMWVISHLWRNSDELLPVRHWLEERLGTDGGAEEEYFRTLSCLKFLDSKWLQGFISKKTGIPLHFVEMVTNYDPEFPIQFVSYGIASTYSLKFPKELKQKTLMFMVLDLLLMRAGNRWKMVTPHMFTNEGFDWDKFGPYLVSISPMTGRVESITHRPTNTIAKVPEEYYITMPFTVEFPWSDLDAAIVKGKMNQKIHMWFEQEEGPNLCEVLKGSSEKLKEMVDEAMGERRDEEDKFNRRKVSTSAPSSTPSPAWKTMEKAREALASQKELFQERRRLRVTGKATPDHYVSGPSADAGGG